MALAILLIGVLLISTGIKGTERQLGAQLQQDLTGTNGFLTWFFAIFIIGVAGYVPYFQKPSRYLIALIFVVLVLSNSSGFAALFKEIIAAEQAGPVASITPNVSTANAGSAAPGQAAASQAGASAGTAVASAAVSGGIGAVVSKGLSSLLGLF
jgi:hypothetical protein